MRRFIISFVSIIILYVLQCTVFKGALLVAGVAPNLMLMFTCIVGFMRGRKSGMITGFAGGMLIDIMSGGMIGFTPLLYLLAGYYNGMFYKEYTKEQMLLPISLVAMCDFSYGLIYYFVTYLMRNRLNLGYYISTVIMPETIYTVVVTIFAYIFVYYINRKLDSIDKKRKAKMLKEQLADFFKDLGYILKKIFTSRMVPFAAAGAVLFAILIIKLFNMQIVHGDDYTDSYIMKAEKTVTTTGTRGDIYDTNGKLLAYSELAYSVVIEDSGTYTSTSVKNASINAVIAKMIEIIENNGDSIDYDFGLACNDSGYYYTVSDNALLRFLRDMYGRSAISKLTDDERNSTPADSAEVLRNRYKIYTAEDVENLKETEAAKQAKNPKFKLTDYDSLNIYDDITAMKIAYVRYNLAANSYKRYLSFTVSSNVNEHTMAAILENKDILTGVSIEEDTVRKYNYSKYIAHIIGYTGKVSSDQLEELQAIDSSYDATDIVGKSGIEQQYETTLSGTKGTRTMLVDNVGRVLEVTNEVEAVAGKDVYLTIDIDLQEKIYKLLERRLAEIVVSYLTQSDSPFKDDGQILIPIKDVYFALINNNVIDIDKIASSDTAAAQTTYSLFSTQKNTVLAAINADLESGDIAYGAQTDDMKSYLKLVRRILIDDGIINSAKITASDDLSKQWAAGNISLRQYLEGAINNQWVNIYNLDISSDYPTTDEVLACVLDYASDAIAKSTDFDKLIYEYLIDNHILSGREVCLILMEQRAVEYTESEYVNITNGGSTFDFLETKIANLDITPAQLALDPCSGSCVVEDPNSGSILAMVSYPSYDINYFQVQLMLIIIINC